MDAERKLYVVGFAFNLAHGSMKQDHLVLLMRKARPEWQAGKLNGVGGKIEPGETPTEAMVREFGEETGVITASDDWRPFAELNGPDWTVYFFETHLDYDTLWHLDGRATEGEVLTVQHCQGASRFPRIPNLAWLIPLALDVRVSGASYARVTDMSTY